MDPARAMRLRKVVEQEGQAYLGRLPEMKYLLAPFIARNAKEQEAVYRIWEEFVAEYKGDWEQWGTETPQVLVDEEQPWYQRYRRWLLAAVLLPMLGGLAYFLWEGGVEPILEEEYNVALSRPVDDAFKIGAKVTMRNRTIGTFSVADSSSFVWELHNVEDGTLIQRDSSWDFNWKVNGELGQRFRVSLSSSLAKFPAEKNSSFFEANIHCSTPPILKDADLGSPIYSIGENRILSVSTPEEDVIYQWQIDDQEPIIGSTFEAFFSSPGNHFIQLEAFKGTDSVYCYSSARHQIQVQAPGKPYLAPLPLQRDAPRQYLQIANWVWGLVLWPLLISLYFWWRWRRRGKAAETAKTEEELAAAYPISDAGPYYVPYQDQEAKINVPADFYRIADQLRIREAGGRTVFDSAASVSATVQGGGYPSWRETAIHQPAEYLLLLPYTHEFEQRECLLRRLGDFLAEHEAAITTYYHRGDFRHFWNKDYPDGWSATRLLSRYQDYRLIILDTGHGLVDPYESQQPRLLPDLEQLFHRWPRRLLLTTEAVVDWSWQERLLYQHFLLYPADTEGMRKGTIALNQVEEYEPGQYRKWTEELQRHRHEQSSRYRGWVKVADHRAYLADDPELFRWLCGLAVAAQPDFRLTIAIGRALGIEVTHDRLLRLGRIPWLAGNSPAAQLRLALMDELSDEDEVQARLAVLAELEVVASQVQGSFAQTEWVANKAVQQFALEPANPKYKQQIRELRQLGLFSGDQLQELEHGLQKDGPSTSSATELPQLDKWLDTPEPQPWFTTDLVWGLLLCLLALIGSLACWNYNQTIREYKGGELPAWQRTAEVDDEALSKNNTAVLLGESLGREESYQEFVNNQEFWDRAYRQLEEALDLRESNYPLADSNRYALEYNRRAKYLNFFLADSTTTPQGLIDAEGNLLLQSLEADLNEFMASPENDWSLDYAHAIGLMYFYLSTTEGVDTTTLASTEVVDKLANYIYLAVGYYNDLRQARDSTFFDSLALTMPVNLQTVLQSYLNTASNLPDSFYGLIGENPPGDPTQQEQLDDPSQPPIPEEMHFRLTLKQLRVIKDGDGVFDGAGDFTWDIKVNGTTIAQTNREYALDDGDVHTFNVVREFTLPFNASSDLNFNAMIIENDSGGTGDDDVVRLNRRHNSQELMNTAIGSEVASSVITLAGNDGGDPSVTLSYTLERISNSSEQQSINPGSDAPPEQNQGVSPPTGTGPPGAGGIGLFWLYFDIGQPQAVATSSKTTATYEDLYNAYYNRQEEIIDLVTKGLSAEDAFSARTNYEGLFFGLRNGFRVFEQLQSDLLADLQAGQLVVVNLRGTLPPDNPSQAAENLIARRMDAIQNSLRAYQGGVLRQYLDAGQLQIETSLSEWDSADPFNASGEYTLDQLELRKIELNINSSAAEIDNEVGRSANPIRPQMVSIPRGTFTMGDTFGEGDEDELPTHEVTLSSFQMGRYEVTFDEYDRFCEATGKVKPDDNGWGRGRRPVINVSWYDAVSYCNWLSRSEGLGEVYFLADSVAQMNWSTSNFSFNISGEAVGISNAGGYRLPTEAEWEYAASYSEDPGRKSRFGNGRDTARWEEMNFYPAEGFLTEYSEQGEWRRKTLEGGLLGNPNTLGIYDLAGNVAEWCSDSGRIYNNGPQYKPFGRSDDSRVIKGGAWPYPPIECRNSDRKSNRPDRIFPDTGFRVVN